MAAIQTASLYTILNINSNIKRTYLIQEGYVTSMLMYTTLSRFQNFSDITSFSRHIVVLVFALSGVKKVFIVRHLCAAGLQ